MVLPIPQDDALRALFADALRTVLLEAGRDRAA
jgi:hypothetical protein